MNIKLEDASAELGGLSCFLELIWGRNMALRTEPPFRADHVGSILRSSAVKEARAQREAGAMSAAELKEVEDREIAKLVAKEESIGLKSITDGEYRRSWWHFDFFGMLDGVEIRD